MERKKVFTTKEFDLLTFLAGHPNRVFTKEELFNKIWDMESLGRYRNRYGSYQEDQGEDRS